MKLFIWKEKRFEVDDKIIMQADFFYSKTQIFLFKKKNLFLFWNGLVRKHFGLNYLVKIKILIKTSYLEKK